MVTKHLILNRYPQQNYSAFFNQKTGFFLRVEDTGCDEPFWCETGPELMDISITNYCDRGCEFCYKKSNTFGSHMSLENYEFILQQAERMKVFQIALGGGNPNQHPDFSEILRLTRETYNIVPSYTTNGRGLTNEILEASKKYCGAVAVSAYQPYNECFSSVQKFLDYKIRTNIHFLLKSDTLETAVDWLRNPPKLLSQINAIIFLNYKPVGRSPDLSYLLQPNEKLKEFFKLANDPHPFKIGFDSCSISGIVENMSVSQTFLDFCEAARFSMYISEDMKMYPCSFLVEKSDGVPVSSNNIQAVWRNHESFTIMRELLMRNQCNDCDFCSTCHGGCPVFPEINLCLPNIPNRDNRL